MIMSSALAAEFILPRMKVRLTRRKGRFMDVGFRFWREYCFMACVPSIERMIGYEDRYASS
jgi:hypothetical protein